MNAQPRTWRWLLLLAALLVVPLAAQQPKTTSVSGELKGSTVWTGIVEVTGNVRVPTGCSLEIARGTVVRFLTQDPAGKAAHLLIEVEGSFKVNGSPAAPVVFEPDVPADDKSSNQGTWFGIRLLPGLDLKVERTVRGAIFKQARSGLQLPEGDAVVEDCLFVQCAAGIEVGSAYADERNRAVAGGTARLEAQRCRFLDCRAGVYAEGRGMPAMRRCLFVQCGTGVGNDRIGISFQLEEPGFLIERCEFRKCSRGLLGTGYVGDTVFVDNGLVLEMSHYHATYATEVDHVMCRNSLLSGNQRVVLGETDLGFGWVEGDPGYDGPVTALFEPGPPLPAGIKLRTDSPARGKATDGGDLGPFGDAGRPGASAGWAPLGTTAAQCFALEILPAHAKKGPPGAPQLGVEINGSWWCLLPATGAFVRLRDFADVAQQDFWIAAPIELTAGGPLECEVNADVDTCEVTWNGRAVAGGITTRRYGGAGKVLALQGNTGKNLLLLRLKCLGADPNLGIAFRGAGVPPAPPPPVAGAAQPFQLAGTRLQVEKDGKRWLLLTGKDAFHFAERNKKGLARLRTPGGDVIDGGEAMGLELQGSKKARLGPLPALRPGAELVLQGLRLPDGTVCAETVVVLPDK